MSTPLRFCTLISTPAVVPSPGTSGKLKPNAVASGRPNSFRLMRAAMESSASWGPRCSQGLRFRKIVAPFVELDPPFRKLSPASATMFTTAGSDRRICSILATVAVVRCSDAASGSWTESAM